MNSALLIIDGVAIRQRFADPIVQRLQRIAWWDWPFDLIMRRLADFQSPNIEAFCARCEEQLRNGQTTAGANYAREPRPLIASEAPEIEPARLPSVRFTSDS